MHSTNDSLNKRSFLEPFSNFGRDSPLSLWRRLVQPVEALMDETVTNRQHIGLVLIGLT